MHPIISIPSIEKGWCLSTVELVAVLQTHGATLRTLERFIKSVTVQRLFDSLRLQNTFTILNPIDLETVCQALSIEGSEQQHLVAAILATGIQQKLTTRFVDHPQAIVQAREAAYVILPYLESMITGPLTVYRDIMKQNDEASLSTTEAANLALHEIDRGWLAIYAVENMNDEAADRRNVAQEAFAAFTHAEALLQRIGSSGLANWVDWSEEVRRGLQRAEDYGGQF